MDFITPTNIKQTDKFLESILINEESNWSQYKIKNLNEDAKSVVADNVVTKLFNDIKTKSMNVDFSMIDASKGDITKLKNYSALSNSINYLEKISSKHPELKPVSTELLTTLNILIKYRREFQTSLQLGNSVVRFVYNGAVVGLIQGTSFAIAHSVEFIKDNLNLYTPKVKDVKKLEKNSHIKSIVLFNEMDKKGRMIKFFKDINTIQEATSIESAVRLGKTALDKLKNVKLGAGGKIATVLSVVGLALVFSRTFIFMYYNTRIKLSQYLNHLQEFVTMNASTLGPDSRNVKEKQEKVAKRLQKLADVINVDQNVSNDRTESQINDSNKIIAVSNDSNNTDNSSGLDIY